MASNHVWKAAVGVGALLAGSVVAAAAPAGDPGARGLTTPPAGQPPGGPEAPALMRQVGHSVAVATGCCASGAEPVAGVHLGRRVASAGRTPSRRQPALSAARPTRPHGADAAVTISDRPPPRPPQGLHPGPGQPQAPVPDAAEPQAPVPDAAEPQAPVPDDSAAGPGTRSHGRDRSQAGDRGRPGAALGAAASHAARPERAPASGRDRVAPAPPPSPGRSGRQAPPGGGAAGGS